jgi:hypothetical protein
MHIYITKLDWSPALRVGRGGKTDLLSSMSRGQGEGKKSVNDVNRNG